MKGLVLADPHFSDTGTIDLLLGTDIHAQIVECGIIKGGPHEPIATQTRLGWLISGETAAPAEDLNFIPSAHPCSIQPTLEDLLQRFWQQEEVVTDRPEKPDDVSCEKFFVSTYEQLPDSRYMVR